MTAYAILLDAPDVTLATAGGKAGNLRALLCVGFPVPPGFVVPTATYRAFVTASGLAERILALGRGAEPDDPESFERAAAAIRELFAAAPVSDDLAAAIVAAYRALGQPAVAVRSSATAEDLPAASFAGQQDTYLNVHGESVLLDAVRRCWASRWTERALALPGAPGYRLGGGCARGCRAGAGPGRRGRYPLHRQSGDRRAGRGRRQRLQLEWAGHRLPAV
jgi:rifampicin phosphotransferase